MANLLLRLRERYEKEGGVFHDPIRHLYWPYRNTHDPTLEELARGYNGQALSDLTDSDDSGKVLLKQGQ